MLEYPRQGRPDHAPTFPNLPAAKGGCIEVLTVPGWYVEFVEKWLEKCPPER